MRTNRELLLCLGVSVFGIFTLSTALFGQAARSPEATIPVPTDWSHHSLIFSRPATTEQAERVRQDPRYWQQRYRSQLPAMLPAAQSHDALASELHTPIQIMKVPPPKKKKGDWAESLGAGGSVGAGNYPAKVSFLGTTANCGTAAQPDFVIYSTGLAGSPTQASIVAYDNLYTGCGGTVPSNYWAYNTGGQILTSPVYSLDGTQVAFVQTNLGDEGTLVLLKWAASTTQTVGAPETLIPVLNSAYPGCSAPCMTEIILSDNLDVPTNDTTSSVYVDYSGDTGWVGGASGWLHKITPMFNGLPAEVHSAEFPVQVNAAGANGPNSLSSPVYDSASGNVFVGDYGGYLYRVSATGGVTNSAQLDFGAGVVDSPEVDSTAGLVYVFASSDGSSVCSAGLTACAAVYQLSTTFAAGDFGFEAQVGASVAFGTLPNPNPLYDGDFDSAYKNSGTATGSLYVCGTTGGVPTIYQVAIENGGMGTVNVGPALASSGTPACSPVTDILNPNATGGATEWIFASAQANGTSSACAAGGCIFNFKDSPWQPSTVYTAGQEIVDSNFHIEVVETGGTSGTATPFWEISTGAATTDHTVTWLDQGLSTAATPAAWESGHLYGVGVVILDSNNNLQRCTVRGSSGATPPTWNTTVGGTTTDGASAPPLTWTNLGVIATAALPAAGGTSGIIIDNMVSSGTLSGTSQIYFSTLSNQTTCGTASNVGCAVQASQSALQ
jgi:hypothetical protein